MLNACTNNLLLIKAKQIFPSSLLSLAGHSCDLILFVRSTLPMNGSELTKIPLRFLNVNKIYFLTEHCLSIPMYLLKALVPLIYFRCHALQVFVSVGCLKPSLRQCNRKAVMMQFFLLTVFNVCIKFNNVPIIY